MLQKPIAMGRLVKGTTLAVLLLTVALYVGAVWLRPLGWAALFLTVLILLTYLAWTPVGYEVVDGELRVLLRVGRLRFGRILRCGPVDEPVWRWVGVFRNGGLFSISGKFWSSRLKSFSAHTTTARLEQMLLVETEKRKVIISPEDLGEFAAACAQRGRN